MKIIIYVLIMLTYVSMCSCVTAQDLRSVSISTEEGIFQATILLKQVDIRIRNTSTYTWYRWNELHHTKGGFNGKLLHGDFTHSDLNYNPLESGKYRYGTRHGGWKSWNTNGKLLSIERWQHGKKNGRFKHYAPSGKLITQGIYRNGMVHKTKETIEKDTRTEKKKESSKKKSDKTQSSIKNTTASDKKGSTKTSLSKIKEKRTKKDKSSQ